MRILVVYATTEGQTRKIAAFLAERFTALGHRAACFDAAEAPAGLDPADYDAVVLAGSLHAGRYQTAIEHFVRRHAGVLARKPSAFVSVSLAAAGHDDEDREGLAACVARFQRETGWSPGLVEHVAGAFRFTHYDFFKKWALKYIGARKGLKLDTRHDLELTDWPALEAFAARFVSGAAADPR